METIIKIGQLLLSLSILIVLHELGHFLFARLFKTRVEKFYLFFDAGFSLFKVKKGETEYGIGWLPLGGYVKISGMIDESMDKKQLAKEPQPYEFRSKKTWQRLLIMLGGVIVNLILGAAIYTMVLFTWGENYVSNKSLDEGVWVLDSVMTETGLQTGDKIISINGNEPESFTSIYEHIIFPGTMIVERDGAKEELTIPVNIAGMISDNRIHNEGLLLYPRIPFVIGEVPDTSINAGSGLQQKDQVIAINGQEVKNYDLYKPILDSLKDENIVLTVVRENKNLEIPVKVSSDGKLEVIAVFDYYQLAQLGYFDIVKHKYTFWQSIPAGFKKAKSKLLGYVRQFKLIFNFDTGAYKGIGGFKAIGGLFPPVWHWQSFWELTAFLSLMLAFLNILPIPALDGGHVAFLLFEMITGRKPGEKFLEYAQIIGMVMLLFLLLYANGNDVYRWILKLMGNG
jgi:regulator of sigma E protease